MIMIKKTKYNKYKWLEDEVEMKRRMRIWTRKQELEQQKDLKKKTTIDMEKDK